MPGCIALIDLSNALNITVNELLNKYMYNKKNFFLEKIALEFDNLSDYDLNLILNIIDFCAKNK